ncbi:MAG TPA: S-methyl-5'-thioinosine phosphorylase [Xanthomonadales bacterium]|nr:S-methyl-5'-thioinosine phosphorylase [Xanthomonadales bacterium]
MSRKTLALIGGTGLNELGELIEVMDLDTPFGKPSAPLQMIRDDELRILFLPRHGSPHTIPPHCVNYRANIRALKDAGADHILAVSAVGGIGSHCSPGSLHALDQVVDYTWGRQHTYSDSGEVNLQHVDFSYPYEGPLRNLLLQVARESDIRLNDGGCVGVFQGPRLESAAEIQRAKGDGCTLAGMTSMPEASLARECGLDYAGIGVVSNWGAGVISGTISEDDIAQTLKDPMSHVRKLIRGISEKLAGSA